MPRYSLHFGPKYCPQHIASRKTLAKVSPSVCETNFHNQMNRQI